MQPVEDNRELAVNLRRDVGGELVISARDIGVGLPPEAGASFTRKTEGAGMGMAIRRSFIESHRGRPRTTSNSARGAIFRFTLSMTSEALT